MPSFWAGRRVLVTGHTGFKGSWLTFWLTELGAEVSGLSLAPETTPNLHDILGLQSRGRFVHADINDRAALSALVKAARPEVVIHMAAQALVRRSYRTPVETFAANVVGTVTLLDVVRECPETRAVLVITSDKVYENLNWHWGYRETDMLGGHDPYSASKACTEIAVASMRRAYFGPGGHPARIATARAGNVIGGGDWSEDRLVPDLVRGCLGSDGEIHLRNPNAVRTWQHVTDPLGAYMMIAEGLATGAADVDENWNIGPDASDNRAVIDVAEALVSVLGVGRIVCDPVHNGPHEATLLTLDCAKAKGRLGWRPRFTFEECIQLTAEWYAAWHQGEDMVAVTRRQLATFGGP